MPGDALDEARRLLASGHFMHETVERPRVNTSGNALVRTLVAELEAARAVVEAAKGADGAYQHAYLCAAAEGAQPCSCGLVALTAALKAYDAAKAGKAVE